MALLYRLRGVVKARAVEGVGFRLVVPRLEIHTGEKIALLGESGSGKSTLLDILAMILAPSEARIFQFTPQGEDRRDIVRVWERRNLNLLSELRKRHIGYVLQTGGLLPFLKVRDNIALSRRLLALPEDDTVEDLAQRLGIERQLDKLPGLLSAGERQRVAIARALAHGPSVVIADEPTASLDPITARNVMALFMELAEGLGITVIVASHEWAHVEELGLRALEHASEQKAGGTITESVFGD